MTFCAAVDSEILRKWDDWIAKKLAGQPVPYQLPIAEDIGRQDPGARGRYAQPASSRRAAEPAGELPARVTALPAVAALQFEDGSSCRCADDCQSYADCCEVLFPGVCALGGGGSGGSKGLLSPCPVETAGLRSFEAEAAERDVSFLNSAPYPVQLLVLDLAGAEVPMGTLQPHGQLLEFEVARQHAWRVRTMAGQLVLEVSPSARPLRRYEVVACELSAAGFATPGPGRGREPVESQLLAGGRHIIGRHQS